jgi:hypothetical protein
LSIAENENTLNSLDLRDDKLSNPVSRPCPLSAAKPKTDRGRQHSGSVAKHLRRCPSVGAKFADMILQLPRQIRAVALGQQTPWGRSSSAAAKQLNPPSVPQGWEQSFRSRMKMESCLQAL